MSVKVSVCIPVYGVEKYIERCARSLFEQTMREGIEFIFVNDCTPDKSIEILERVLSEYPHRKAQTEIIHHEKNSGLVAARKTGLAHASGEYIIHCDSDDWVELDMYEKMYLAAKENDADMVYCDYIREMPDSRKEIRSGGTTQNANELICEFLSRKTVWYLWNRMYRREIAQKDYSATCLEHISYMEDGLRNCSMLRHCRKISCIREPLYHYNCCNLSAMTYCLSQKSRKMAIEAIAILDRLFPEKKYQKALDYRLRQSLFIMLPTDFITPGEWHKLYKRAKRGMWKDKHFSFKAKCIFYLACINYPLAGYIYKKLKGIS